ncbi:MAG: undecaprenyl-phosphate glucose phosphotransferase [Methylophilaceae bacterium]
MRFRQQLSYRKPMTPAMLVKMLLDPILIIGTLLTLAYYYDDLIDREYMLLSLMIFALTFPGTWSKNSNMRSELAHILTNWPILVGILVFFGYTTTFLEHFDHDVVVGWVFITPLVMFVLHVLIRKLLERLRSGQDAKVAVIVGANDIGLQMRERLSEEASIGIHSQGFFDDRPSNRTALGEDGQNELLGRLADVANYIRTHSVDIIYMALPMSSQPRVLNLLDDLKDTTASLYFVPDIFVFDLIQARIDDVAGIPVVAVCETPFYGMNGFIKRASDIVLSLLILLLISPIMLVLALGVKLSSSGPILFKQRRYGLDGRDIIVYKFRSMTVCEDGGKVVQATRNDKRVTPFGAFIRKTSLDELPQFINVLQGRMSIVGPRPHAVAHNEEYRKLIKGYMIRHKVKPGITGWAQVNGFRGETDTVDKMKMRIDYDLDYLRRWNLVLDMKIIMRTALLVMMDKQAY